MIKIKEKFKYRSVWSTYARYAQPFFQNIVTTYIQYTPKFIQTTDDVAPYSTQYSICMRMKINWCFEQFAFHNEPRRNKDEQKIQHCECCNCFRIQFDIANSNTLYIKCRSYLCKSKLSKDFNEKSDGDDDKKRLPTIARTIFSYQARVQ